MASTILADNGVSSGSAGIKTTADSTGALALQTTTAGGAATTAVTINTSQNVGIGTSSPAVKLDVVGSNQTTIARTYAGSTSFTQYIDDSAGGVYLAANTASGSNAKFLAFQTVPSGGAATERARIDSSGNVGIGTSSPSTYNSNASYNKVTSIVQSDQALTFGSYYQGGVGQYGLIRSSNAANTGITDMKYEAYQHLFFTASGASGTERMRIDASGAMLLGATSITGSGRVRSTTFDANKVCYSSWGDTNYSAFQMVFNASQVGTISCTASTTSYNTSSDYRLKDNVQPMTGALSVVAQLKPCTYTWKADGSDGQGFIAHELQAVVPDCVTGEKDAVDADGNPVYQGIDTSFLVATLTAAIQELNAKFEEYKATHP